MTVWVDSVVAKTAPSKAEVVGRGSRHGVSKSRMSWESEALYPNRVRSHMA